MNDFFFDQYVPRIVDGILPISEFLINHIKKVSPFKKFLKVPVLVDFEAFINYQNTIGEKYFLFCGAAAYKEIILFIIDSYCLLNNNKISLYLIINGNINDKLKIKNYIDKTNYKKNIKIFSNLSEQKLHMYYKNAIGLLIPLRPTIQDSARFPHKIGEYLASGNPVVSTNYGEVKNYFHDKQNMLIADNYDYSLFADKMKFILNNELESKKIGKEGQKIVQHNFNYMNYAALINNLINDITR